MKCSNILKAVLEIPNVIYIIELEL